MTTLPLTEHKRNVLRAWLDGKTVQRLATSGQWVDYPDCQDSVGNPPGFSSRSDSDYRIKPTPARRFWKPEEIPVGYQVREIGSSLSLMIVAVGPGYASLSMGLEINATNYMKYVIAPPGPANAVQWQPAGVEE